VPERPTIDPARFDAVLFDLDGVLTPTARVHSAAWKRTFDSYLEERAARTGEPWTPFDRDADYVTYVDGKPRVDGVISFLASRGITLPRGEPDDPPDRETDWGVGNRKDAIVSEVLRTDGVEAYPGSLALVHALRAAGVRTAVVSSSKNCKPVLDAAGISDLFDARVDGVVAEAMGLAGKPAPDTYLEGARRLGAAPERAVVFEDALSGVASGRAGGFGLVVGVNRQAGAAALRENGADIVVDDLGEVAVALQATGPSDGPGGAA
jgi:beta-phosphoglucomutase family hydrolase